MSDVKWHYQTTPPTVTNGNDVSPRCDPAGSLMVNTSGSNAAPAAAGDATANPSLFGQLSYILGFNGTTWDRIRTGILAKTATVTGVLNSLVMGRYNLNPPTLTDGDAQLAQLDAAGNVRAADQYITAYNFTNITAATTTVVKSGSGVLHSVVFNTYVGAATVTIYDNTAASGQKIATITLPAAGAGDVPLATLYDIEFQNGLTIVTSGATDLTVAWSN